METRTRKVKVTLPGERTAEYRIRTWDGKLMTHRLHLFFKRKAEVKIPDSMFPEVLEGYLEKSHESNALRNELETKKARIAKLEATVAALEKDKVDLTEENKALKAGNAQLVSQNAALKAKVAKQPKKPSYDGLKMALDSVSRGSDPSERFRPQ